MIKQSHIPVALAITPLANVRPDEVIFISSFYFYEKKRNFLLA